MLLNRYLDLLSLDKTRKTYFRTAMKYHIKKMRHIEKMITTECVLKCAPVHRIRTY